LVAKFGNVAVVSDGFFLNSTLKKVEQEMMENVKISDGWGEMHNDVYTYL